LDYDEQSIISMAREIAATEDAFFHLMGDADLDASEAEFLLRFQDPLTALAELWEPHFGKSGITFDAILYEFLDDENLELYPLMPDMEHEDMSNDKFDEAIVKILESIISVSGDLLNIMAKRLGTAIIDEINLCGINCCDCSEADYCGKDD
jgi:hypothetical protein